MDKIKFLNGNAVKILAAILMLVDHVGYLLLPQYPVLRIIGRVSFPLFAYMLAEGCRYTADKIKHFAFLFSLAVLCQVVYYFFDYGNLNMSVLVTFSLSVITIYALQYFKRRLFDKESAVSEKILAGALFAAVVVSVYALNTQFSVDYGFWGCMLPVFVSLFDFKDIPMPEKIAKLDNHCVKLCCLAAGLLFLSLNLSMKIEYYAFIALIPLFFYNGKKGKLRMKYFFYIFYPLHLAVLQGLSYIL